MYYYAHINECSLVDAKYAFDVPTTEAGYIEITEDQYYNLTLGFMYNPDTNTFDEFYWSCTTNDINYPNTYIMLTHIIDEINEDIANKANVDHTHSGYASSDDLQTLEDVVDTKANSTHTHSEYASVNHSHSEYATTVALDTLGEEVNGKANASHAHSNYSETTHNHDASYSPISHDHDEDYAAISHSHSNYATVDSVNELSTAVSGKANASHTHDDRYYTESEIDTKLADKADSNHNHAGVYDVAGAAASALSSANSYTDTEIDAINEAVATKANTSNLNSHTGNTTVHITSVERDNWNAAKIHADSAHAPTNAEPNQNAFSNIVVGNTTISADTKTDTLTLIAGDNVTITPDATGDAVTISSANTVYTHPTSVGNKHIPAGGSSGQILRWASDGTAVWGNDNNTTYGVATETANGLMSVDDKTKLNGIAEGANNYTLPSAGSALGGVKTGGDVTISSGVITVNDDSHNHIISNVDGLQSALDAKAASSHSHNDTYYTETEVDTLLSSKANSSHTHTIANVTNLQSALDGKAATSHGTHVSFSTTAPVMDGSASVGTATTVARSDHKHPVDTSRAAKTELDALAETVSGKANSSHTHTIANVTNLQSTLDGKASSGHTHGAATTSASGFMTKDMVTKLNGIAAGANAYTLPTASSTLGGVKTTSTVTSTSGYTACPIISGVPYYKDTNTTYSLSSFGVTATAAELNALDGITASVTELNYVDGVTSNIQTQLNGKAASSHNHSGVYANASHSHTASAVGAIATGDVATVSEVETYLGI